MAPGIASTNLIKRGRVEALSSDVAVEAGEVVALLGRNEERHEPNLDRVLKTILFTDIVGSTEQAAELGDRQMAGSA